MPGKGETFYFKEVDWNGSRGHERSYELYKRIDDETSRRISGCDQDGGSLRDFGYRLSIDLNSGDVYEHVESIQEKDWTLRQFNDAIAEGVNYEKLNSPLVDENWIKANAFDLVHMLLKRKNK